MNSTIDLVELSQKHITLNIKLTRVQEWKWRSKTFLFLLGMIMWLAPWRINVD